MKLQSVADAAAAAHTAARSITDIVVPMTDLVIHHPGGDARPTIGTSHGPSVVLTDRADAQLATMLGIGSTFSQDCSRRFPETWASVLRQYIAAAPSADRPGGRVMLRQGPNSAKAIVSGSYLRLDAAPVADAITGVIESSGDFEMFGATYRDGYYKAVARSTKQHEIIPGDALNLGLRVTTNEIGGGALAAELFFYRSLCMNGAIFGKQDLISATREHRGNRRDQYGVLPGVEQHETDAIMAWLEDFLGLNQQAAEMDSDGGIFSDMREGAKKRVLQDAGAWQIAAKSLRLTDEQAGLGWRDFMTGTGAPGSAWALGNAVTFLGNHVTSVTEQNRLERAGGEIMGMNGLWDLASVSRLNSKDAASAQNKWETAVLLAEANRN